MTPKDIRVVLPLSTQVKVEGLNDSKMIGVCIYNIVVLSFLGVMVSLTLKSDYDLNYGITSSIIVLATTFTQCLIVVPKVCILRTFDKLNEMLYENCEQSVCTFE